MSASLFSYFFHADVVVQSVMLMLLAASVVSWSFIIQKFLYFRTAFSELQRFEERFWSGAELNQLYRESEQNVEAHQGAWSIFQSGFREFLRLKSKSHLGAADLLDAVRRAMYVSECRVSDAAESQLAFLASIGSISPYIGLFGTVWGIMNAIHALGDATQQVTLSMIAPGISETLIATAMGLFVSIPAVFAYNRYRDQADRLLGHYETFGEEFRGILTRQLQHVGGDRARSS